MSKNRLEMVCWGFIFLGMLLMFVSVRVYNGLSPQTARQEPIIWVLIAMMIGCLAISGYAYSKSYWLDTMGENATAQNFWIWVVSSIVLASFLNAIRLYLVR